MKPWMEAFIHQCLVKIPDLLYRKRLTAELSDHLASLSEDLEAEGLPAGQAQALALKRMGQPRGAVPAALWPLASAHPLSPLCVQPAGSDLLYHRSVCSPGLPDPWGGGPDL